MAFRLLVPPNNIEVKGDINLGGIITDIADLLDFGLEPIVAVDRVLGMVAQDRDPMDVLSVDEYTKVLVTYSRELASDVGK